MKDAVGTMVVGPPPVRPLPKEVQASIVEDCPVCFRTIWAGTKCNHGGPPSPYSDAPKESPLGVDDPNRLDPKPGKGKGRDDLRGGVNV